MVICGEVIISRAQHPLIIYWFILQHTWQSTVAGLLETLDWSFLRLSVQSDSKLTLHVIRCTSWKDHRFISSSQKSDWMIQIKQKWPRPNWFWATARDRTILFPQEKCIVKGRNLGGGVSQDKDRKTGKKTGEEALTVWYIQYMIYILLWFYPEKKGLCKPLQPWMSC